MIDMIMRFLSNNQDSISVNGQSYGFSASIKGLKQGDPLFYNSFVIAAKVLARGLNNLKEDKEFIGFGLPKWSEQINYIFYANEIILFCKDRETQ